MGKIRKILYLPIETLVREGDSRLLLAHEALNRGYQVVIGDSNEVKLFARHIGGGVYLYKHWEAKFPYRFDDERRKNYYYLGLHQEGLIWNDPNTFRRRMTEKGRSEKLDLNFVKGEVQRGLLEEFYPQLAPILKVVGDPAFDLLRQQFQPLFETEVSRLRATWGTYVLVNTNFTLGNNAVNYTGDFLSNWNYSSIKNVGRPLTEEERENILQSIEFYKKLYEEYRNMLGILSARYPSVSFILRPHPSENHERWKEDLKKFPNVHVLFEGNVINWILGSSAVIHTGCTTGIEAWALRKPVIRYNPLGKENPYESKLSNRFGVFISSLESLSDHLTQVLEGKVQNSFDDQVHFLKSYLDSIDGPLSVKRVMNEVDALNNFLVEEKPGADIYRYRRERWISTLYNTLVRLVVKYPQLTSLAVGKEKAYKRAAMFQKLPSFKKKLVAEVLGKISRIENPTHPLQFSVKRVDANVFFLERA